MDLLPASLSSSDMVMGDENSAQISARIFSGIFSRGDQSWFFYYLKEPYVAQIFSEIFSGIFDYP